MDNSIFYNKNDFSKIDEWIINNNIKKIFLVAGDSINNFDFIKEYFDEKKNEEIEIIRFKNFTANPKYEDIVEGVKLFNESKSDSIIVIGGGSAIDVAKCIKCYSKMDHNKNYLSQDIIDTKIPFLAIPTTAGSGSEVTRYSVIYYNGEKQSITHDSLIPDNAIYYIDTLKSLSMYQKKATILDSFCHAFESYLSINSNDESKKYSEEAIRLVLKNIDEYTNEGATSDECYKEVFYASYLSGKAINITRTTAGHAFCYKLTTLYNLSHGHAVMLCMRRILPFMIKNIDKCVDKRGVEYLHKTFLDLSHIFGEEDTDGLVRRFSEVYDKLDLSIPDYTKEEMDILVNSVNVERLGNNAVKIDEEDKRKLYEEILKKD